MCNNPVIREIGVSNGYKSFRYVKTPCHTCTGCRLDNLQLWQNRCNAEYVKGRNAFITFTYDKYHLQYNDNAIQPTLVPEQIHKFNDNIRHLVKNMPLMPSGSYKDFHYFCSAEYGGIFQRPHAHFLYFGLDFKDFEKFFKKHWKNGLITSLPILSGGVRYVVDYLNKSPQGENAKKEFDDNNICRPFMFNSQGIGFDWFFAHREEVADTGCIVCGARQVPVPSYYVRLFRQLDESNLSGIVLHNKKVAFQQIEKACSNGFSSYQEYLDYTVKAKALEERKRFLKDGCPVPLVLQHSEIVTMSNNQIYSLAESALLDA